MKMTLRHSSLRRMLVVPLLLFPTLAATARAPWDPNLGGDATPSAPGPATETASPTPTSLGPRPPEPRCRTRRTGKDAKTQRRKDAKTQRRKDAKTQRRKDAKTQRRKRTLRPSLRFTGLPACWAVRSGCGPGRPRSVAAASIPRRCG
ncbi:hypothetical protein E3O65_15085 [Cryobacterium breve]|uniref:Secreted protein n=1 Tax=Cryobacterium breve TaxID=1259258 RepID=A0ABY2IUS7_9MICO|nr:hypothetical protein E3T20_10195 [Cryobacterium sp. TmT3-12]TFC95371.1 hypothetical protein E3O65_15085 [Cryobacterium breve]